jgi:molecular chaperone GrpE
MSKEKTEIEVLNEQLEDYKNRYLRALADFDNFKKRNIFEKEQFVQFANEGLAADLLPVMDGLIRGLESAQKAGISEEIIKGFALVKRQLLDSLKKHGVEPILALGRSFDPNLHEAILQKESEGPENIVLEEMQTGYTLNGKLIRPAMVIVSKAPRQARG